MKVHILIQVASGVLILYLAYCSLLFIFQRQILFPRSQVGVPSGIAKNIAGLEKMWLHTSYGKVEAWFLPPPADRGAESAIFIRFV